MMTLSPVWVICALDNNDHNKEFDVFKHKLERQLKAVSYNEDVKNKEWPTWWKITNLEIARFSLKSEIDEACHPSGLDVFRAPAGNYDLSKLTIIYYAHANNFSSLLKTAKSITALQEKNQFMPGTQLYTYGLCVMDPGEDLPTNLVAQLKKLSDPGEEQEQGTKRCIRKILFQGNHNKTGNYLGYDTLIDEKDKDDPCHRIQELSVQIISHLALTKDQVVRMQSPYLFATAGGFSLTFEKEPQLKKNATTIADAIFVRFLTESSDQRWKCETEAEPSTEFKSRQGWNNTYRLLSNFQEKEKPENLRPKENMSPWTFYSKFFIPLYFKKHVHSFIQKLYKNVQEYITDSFIRFSSALENNFYELTQNHKPEMAVKDELMRIWSEKNVRGAVGVKQCDALLDETTTFFEKQGKIVKKLKKGETPDSNFPNFPEPYDYPLKNLGECRPFFEKYWREGKNPDVHKDEYGNNLLKKLTKVLKYHPIPLSLITRSVLVGLFLPFAIYIILRFIPNDPILNTPFFESSPGMWVMLGTVFLASILWGLFKYSKLVLGKIKSLAHDYIGWCIYKTQYLLYMETLNKAEAYYKECVDICTTYKQNLTNFSSTQEGELLNDPIDNKYPQTWFQTDIAGKHEEAPVIRDETVVPKIRVKKKNVSSYDIELTPIDCEKDKQMGELYPKVARTIINFDENLDVYKMLKQTLFPEIPKKSDDSEEDNGEETKDVENVKKYWAEQRKSIYEEIHQKIAEQLGLFIEQKEVKDIADVAFTSPKTLMTREKNNFYITDRENERTGQYISVNELIAGRMRPSPITKGVEHCEMVGILSPNNPDHPDSKWEESFFEGITYSNMSNSVSITSMFIGIFFNDIAAIK